MTKSQEVTHANGLLATQQAVYPVGSIGRAQLQARIDAHNFELNRGN